MTAKAEPGRTLAGLKVLELARILAGPWIGQTLADLGATVIKVEGPDGDDTRHWGPPFIEREGDRSAAYFHAANRGKRSIAADLKDPGDRAVVQALATEADVVVENFRPGGLAKYGLDYDTLAVANPRLVYCSVTGFGQTGPYAGRPGYDYLIQGMCGLMSVTGEPDGPPVKVGIAVADLTTALYGLIGIQAALIRRGITGRGQQVDVALMDCATAIMGNQAMNHLASGIAPRRLGNQHPNIAPYQTFATADGMVILAVGNDRQFAAFCRVVGLDALATDPDFATNPGRVANRDRLIEAIAPSLADWRKAALIEALSAAGVPVGPINDMAEVFADPQVIHRGLQIAPGGVPGVANPLRLSGDATTAEAPCPALDADGALIRAQGFAAGPPEPA